MTALDTLPIDSTENGLSINSNGLHAVSVIIPTTCERKRWNFLQSAIQSVLSQRGVAIELIVVVNGNRFDSEMVQELRAMNAVRVLTRTEGHVSRARHFGLEASSGEFFAFLDDDDELLPDALKARVEYLVAVPAADVVVTNGLVRAAGETPHVRADVVSEIHADPWRSFLVHNWFSSPAALFRRVAIGPEIFDLSYVYFEWTYLFFRLLVLKRRVEFLDVLTYRKVEDNPDSVSKSLPYHLAQPLVIRDMLRMQIPPFVRRNLRKRYVVALNACAVLLLANRDFRGTIRYHAKCILGGGWRYLPFTRRIVAAAVCRR
jgi:glycosyltransferase involved in cell wall biosynthesis